MKANKNEILPKIFNVSSPEDFNALALDVFYYQYEANILYKRFVDLLGLKPSTIRSVDQIPFLPIEFFKRAEVLSAEAPPQAVFLSSGTTGSNTSKHLVTDLKLYENSFLGAFDIFYGAIDSYCVLALLPSYLEREGSSLVYMVNELIKQSKHDQSGFYLNNIKDLLNTLRELKSRNVKTILIGVTYALLDLAEQIDFQIPNVVVMETGGMKGRRKELVREELHQILTGAFGVDSIHSEYGMTELLSQAYSKGNGIFHTPPWMKVLIRDPADALSILGSNKSGGINVIDLANINSCAFLATQDLGKIHEDGSFEILGRFDNSDIRGCNLLVSL